MLDRNVHKTILLEILKDIYTEIPLGPILGFKGGTAANFFYELGRFSVDLDFDLLKSDKDIFVFEKIETILQNHGIIKEKYKKKNTLLFVISYDEKSQNIKVEINCMAFGSRYELKNYLGISMLVMAKGDMFAHKLVAMLERKKTANRDVYDIWHFLKNLWPINIEIVEKRTGMNFIDYLNKCIEFIESLSDRNILSGMGELMEESQKDWAKTNLRKEAVFLLKVRLQQER